MTAFLIFVAIWLVFGFFLTVVDLIEHQDDIFVRPVHWVAMALTFVTCMFLHPARFMYLAARGFRD